MSSFIYKNITVYRAVMQVLYKGKYAERLDPVKKILIEKKCQSVLELCFADTLIASFCNKNKIKWMGLDLNKKFVERANKKGFTAEYSDLNYSVNLPKNKTIVMMGSLYHFQKDEVPFLLNALSSTDLFILNEPVINLSQKKMTAKLSASLTDVGKGPEKYRYSKASLLKLAEEICEICSFSFYIAHEGKKDLTLVFERK
jgi:hypothetical protein